MIGWKYLIPRIIVLVSVLTLLIFALDPFIRWTLIRTGRHLVGAQCEVGNVDTSIWKTEILISDVAIANPRAPMTNLIEFQQARLKLDSISLLKKKFIVDSGRLQSVRIGSSRTTSGALVDVGEDPPSNDKTIPSWNLPWTPDALQTRLQKLEQQFESPPLLHDLETRWPVHVAHLESRIDYVEKRTHEISELAQIVHNEPIEGLARLPEILEQLKQIRQDRQDLQTELRQLADQVRVDRQAVATARHHDTQQIRKYLDFDAVTADQLGELVIGPEWTDRLATIFGWVQWTRRQLPSRTNKVQPSRGRGMNVLFSTADSLPNFLVRELRIDGHWQHLADSVPFTGILHNLTTEPGQLKKPTLLTAQATATNSFTVRVELDHTHQPPQDHLVFDCQNFSQPAMIFGKEEEFAVHLAPSRAHVTLDLDLNGKIITGQAAIRQNHVQLTTTGGPKFQASTFANSFQRMLTNIQSLETTLSLKGTVQRPQGTVDSTLATQLSEALNMALRQELQSQKNMAIARLNKKIDRQLARAESTLRKKQGEIATHLNLADTALQEITDRLPTGSAVSNILGGRLPWQRRL